MNECPHGIPLVFVKNYGCDECLNEAYDEEGEVTETARKAQVVEAVVKALPYPQHITDWDFDTDEGAVRFTWRRDRFRMSTCHSMMVEECKNGCLHGSNLAIVVEALIKRELFTLLTQ